MAHYAFVNDDNIVTEVIVGRDESEGDWEAVYAEVRGQRCLRTSYWTQGNQHPQGRPFRGNYAGSGFRYDEALDAFIPPCPGDGWVLDEATVTWVDNSPIGPLQDAHAPSPPQAQ
jgi:hypothetical protein